MEMNSCILLCLSTVGYQRDKNRMWQQRQVGYTTGFSVESTSRYFLHLLNYVRGLEHADIVRREIHILQTQSDSVPVLRHASLLVGHHFLSDKSMNLEIYSLTLMQDEYLIRKECSLVQIVDHSFKTQTLKNTPFGKQRTTVFIVKNNTNQ